MQKKAKIFYFTLTDEMLKRDKLDWFAETQLASIPFDTIHPDKNNNWLNITDNDFETLIPIASKDVKAGKSKEALFELFSTGIVTARDEWVYDFDKNNLENKVKLFIEKYSVADLTNLGVEIKWSRNLKNHLKRGTVIKYNERNIKRSLRRPFVKSFFYFERGMNDEIGHFKDIVNENCENRIIGINNNSQKFNSLVNNKYFDFASLIVTTGQTQCLPLYRYDKSGNRIDNITDWGLEQFRNRYCHVETQYFASPQKNTETQNSMETQNIASLRKEDIFYYVYAVLHCPAYRTKYEQNLKREFPRIPFYTDFWQWAAWGKELMDLHLNYESVEPFELGIRNYELGIKNPKTKLKANVESGEIVLDEQTTLSGIPSLAWEYKLGNRSALHWILDQYKEKTPSDPTIKAQFNTYKFADYKASVIDLLQRVCTVSVRTMEIVNAMNSL